MAIRYEDFSLDPEEKAAAMLNFVGFTYHDSVKGSWTK